MARALSSSYSRFDTHIFLKVSSDARMEPLQRGQSGPITPFFTYSAQTSRDKWILTRSMWSRPSLGEQKSKWQKKKRNNKSKTLFSTFKMSRCTVFRLEWIILEIGRMNNGRTDLLTQPTLIFTSLGASFLTSVSSLSPKPNRKMVNWADSHQR